MYPISDANILVANVENVTTQEILDETTMKTSPIYVAAVINASQYRDGYTMKYSLGAGDTTIDADGHVFHNREIKESALIFFRVFSINSTQEVWLSIINCVRLVTCNNNYREKSQRQQVCKH